MSIQRESKKWKMLKLLASPQAPRLFTPEYLKDWLEQQNVSISQRNLRILLKDFEQTEVSKIRHGLYSNLKATPLPHLEEAAPWIRKGAVLSLQTVLGRAGVLNNPTQWVTAVIPASTNKNAGLLTENHYTFLFAALQEKFFPKSDDPIYQDCFEPYTQVATATPEKALLDWIQLSKRSSRFSLPPSHDLDWDELDEERLNRLAHVFGLEQELSVLRQKTLNANQEASTVQTGRKIKY